MPSISGRGYVFIGLNAIRALSIISILLVFSSSIVVMVNNIKAVNAFESAQKANDTEVMDDCDYIMGSTVPHQAAGVFWSVVSSLFLICQSIVLLLSEVEWPVSFFDRYFPVLGSGFGLGALGVFQCLMGAQILSHHVDDFTLVSAFFIFSLGCGNMLLGLVFREGAKHKRSITSFREDNKGILPTVDPNTNSGTRPVISQPKAQYMTSMLTGSTQRSYSQKSTTSSVDEYLNERSGLGFGRQGEKAAGLRGFVLQKPEESLPRYAAPPPPPPPPAFPEAAPSFVEPSFYRPANPEPTTTRGISEESLARTASDHHKSARTTTSSFCSPYRKSCQTAVTASVYDGDSMYAPESPVPPMPERPTFTGRPYGDAPPAFKSSNTSL